MSESLEERVQRVVDESQAFSLALLEFFGAKKHSTGAVRVMAPYVTEDEAKGIMKRRDDIVKRLVHDRKKARGELPSGLVVPPGSV